jgi:hypothetical protein
MELHQVVLCLLRFKHKIDIGAYGKRDALVLEHRTRP